LPDAASHNVAPSLNAPLARLAQARRE
jgi:hypothetical protein